MWTWLLPASASPTSATARARGGYRSEARTACRTPRTRRLRGQAVLHALPKEARRRTAPAIDRSERARVVQAAVQHRVAHVARAFHIAQRVAVRDEEVGELARLERPQVLVEANVTRAVERAAAQR